MFRWCQTETSVAQPCQSAKPRASRRSASGTSASGPRLIPHGSTGYGGKDELFNEVVKACDADWPRPWGATLGSSIFAQIEAWLGRPKGRCASAHAHRPDRRHAFALHHMDEVAPPSRLLACCFSRPGDTPSAIIRLASKSRRVLPELTLMSVTYRRLRKRYRKVARGLSYSHSIILLFRNHLMHLSFSSQRLHQCRPKNLKKLSVLKTNNFLTV